MLYLSILPALFLKDIHLNSDEIPVGVPKDDVNIYIIDENMNRLQDGQVGEIDGVKLIKVPDSYLPTNCAFIITHPSVTVAGDKLAEYKVHDNPPGINGNLIEGRVYYDAFILDAKKDGVYAHYTTAPSTTSNGD